MPEGNNIHRYHRFIKNVVGQKIIKGPGKGATVKKIFPKGKVIFVELSNGKTIIMRFGMSGYLSRNKVPPKYTRKTLEFRGAAPIHWVSMRKLGTFRYVSTTVAQRVVDSLGPDPLIETVTTIRKQLDSGRQKTQLGALLLDQSFLSGIGNRLRAQILWEAKLSPFRTLESLSPREKDKLARLIKEIMRNRPYAGNVYRRTRDSLGRPVTRMTIGGRTMWFVYRDDIPKTKRVSPKNNT